MLLPHHTLLLTHEQKQYYHLPIHSTNNSFSSQYNTSLSSLSSSILQTANTPESLKICSLNTNRLISFSKQTLINNFIIESNTEIFGLFETHLKVKDAKFLNLSKNLTNYTNY